MKKYIGEYRDYTEIGLLMISLEKQALISNEQIHTWMMVGKEWPEYGILRLEDAGAEGYILSIAMGNIKITVEP